jgi:riboflavin biosynthesis pyrimidine reductase
VAASGRRQQKWSLSSNDNVDVPVDKCSTDSRWNDITTTGVTLKIAVDRNGAVAETAKSQKIMGRFTCEESLDMVHRLRAVSDVVLVGKGTVLADNPSLLVRRPNVMNQISPQPVPQPLRVILDPQLEILQSFSASSSSKDAVSYQILNDSHPTVIYHTVPDVDDSLLDLDERFVMLVYQNNHNNTQSGHPSCSRVMDVTAILKDVYERFPDLSHVMIEGGPITAQHFLQRSLIDRCILVRAETVEFEHGLPSQIDDNVLQKAGLQYLGSYRLGVDRVDCWSRSNLPWPTQSLSDWP